MSKLKSEFEKDEAMTQRMRVFYDNALNEQEKKYYKFIGAYHYKNYEIFFDHIPENKKIVKHVRIKETNKKRIKQEDLELIANYFIGDNYTVQYGLFDNNMASIWEEKGTIN